MVTEDGPLKNAFERDTKGVVKQEFITYVVKNNQLVGKIRKLSMTINLNEPGDYDGGNLKFDFGSNREDGHQIHEVEEIRPQGSIIVFPSYQYHCVTPVTRGTRYSLVLWCLGEPWK